MKTWTLHFIITMFAVTGFATTSFSGAVEDVTGNTISAEAERAKSKAKGEMEWAKGTANEMKEKAK